MKLCKKSDELVSLFGNNVISSESEALSEERKTSKTSKNPAAAMFASFPMIHVRIVCKPRQIEPFL